MQSLQQDTIHRSGPSGRFFHARRFQVHAARRGALCARIDTPSAPFEDPHMKNAPSRRILWALLCSALLATAGAQAQDSPNGVPQTDLPRVPLMAGMYRIDAQVAAKPDERQTGLMYRREMPQHEGMLFVFEQPATQCFWMKNTLLPLTAAFVADDGTIVNLVDMQPLKTDSHCSTKPVRYVLEMNQGWFDHKKLKAGFKLTGAPFQGR